MGRGLLVQKGKVTISRVLNNKTDVRDYKKKKSTKVQDRAVTSTRRMVVKFFKLNSQRVYQGGWEARTTRQLKQRINRKFIKINLNLIRKVMLGLKSKLR